MKNDLVFKHTSLETSEDVGECLSWKIEAIKADNLPIDTSLADYIAFANDNLEAQLAQLKAVKGEIGQREKALKSQIEHIKVDGATFLLENGLERLEGVICSSVTVTEAKSSKTITTETKEFVMNISQAELEELLIGLGKGEMKTITTEKITNALPAKIRINRRKQRKILIPEVTE